MQQKRVERLLIVKLEASAETNSRVELCPQVVVDYAAAMKEGDFFPPVEVVSDGTHCWLVDGFHRLAAVQRNKEETILAVITQGSFDDAVWASCGANKTHGLRRTNADKRRAVERALLTDKGASVSDRHISRYCGVHHDLVGRVRAVLIEAGRIAPFGTRTVRRCGTTYTQRIEGVSEANRARRFEQAARAAGQRAEPTDPLPTRASSADAAEPVRPVATGLQLGAAPEVSPTTRALRVVEPLHEPLTTRGVALPLVDVGPTRDGSPGPVQVQELLRVLMRCIDAVTPALETDGACSRARRELGDCLQRARTLSFSMLQDVERPRPKQSASAAPVAVT